MNSQRIHHHLDNAATSFPKPVGVSDAVSRALGMPGNPHRGAGTAARDAGGELEAARHEVAEFVGARAERLAFTLNATDALNGAITGLVRDGSRVVVSALEHGAVLRPLLQRERERRIELVRVAPRPDGRFDPAEVAAAARGAALVALTHASNVTGLVQPLARIAQLLPAECVLLVDAAQAAGSVALDVGELGPRAITCLTGHKALLGPMGCGTLVAGDDVELPPWREGGTGDGGDEQPSQMPQRLEAGTPPLPAILGLRAGIAWWRASDPIRVRVREQELLATMLESLRRARVEMPGWQEGERAPLACFRIPGLSPDETALLLESEHGIGVRAGLHCAPSAHRHLGTWPDGLVRVSVGPTTTPADAAAFCAAIADLAR